MQSFSKWKPRLVPEKEKMDVLVLRIVSCKEGLFLRKVQEHCFAVCLIIIEMVIRELKSC